MLLAIVLRFDCNLSDWFVCSSFLSDTYVSYPSFSMFFGSYLHHRFLLPAALHCWKPTVMFCTAL